MTSNYRVPRGQWPGDAPPPKQGDFIQLSAMGSPYHVSRSGMVNLSEPAVDDLHLAFGVDSGKGDYVRVLANQGSAHEGMQPGYMLGLDVAGEGSGSLQILGGQSIYISTAIASAGIPYDPTQPQDTNQSAPVAPVESDAREGQTILREEIDELGNSSVTIETVYPTAQENETTVPFNDQDPLEGETNTTEPEEGWWYE